jgi:hypothetical protein
MWTSNLADTFICYLENGLRTAKTVRPKYSIELVDKLNCYILIILSKAAASIATFKPSYTRVSNAVSVDAIKAYEEVEREFHAFLNIWNTWRKAVALKTRPIYLGGMCRRYPTNRQLGRPSGRSRRLGEMKDFLFLPRIKTRSLGRPARSLVTIPTELPPPALNCYPFLRTDNTVRYPAVCLTGEQYWADKNLNPKPTQTDRHAQMALTVLIITTAEQLQPGVGCKFSNSFFWVTELRKVARIHAPVTSA